MRWSRVAAAVLVVACTERAPVPPTPSPPPAHEARPSRDLQAEEPRATLDPARVPPPERRWRPQRGGGSRCASRYSAGTDEQLFEYDLDANGSSLRRRVRSDDMGWSTIESPRRAHEVDPAQRVIRTSGTEDPPVTYTYDAAGRVVRIENPVVGVVTCAYGDHGWPVEARGADDVVRTYVYDDEGHLLGVVVEEDARRRETSIEREGEGFVEIIPARGRWPEARHRYDGECADVFFTPCSRTYAPRLEE